jgi:hypothetical protein
MAMSEKPSRTKAGTIPKGAIGLLLAIIFCVGIAVSPAGFLSLLLYGALGLVGLVLSIVGFIKKSGRVAAVFGILAFILGCLMTFATLLDLMHMNGDRSR